MTDITSQNVRHESYNLICQGILILSLIAVLEVMFVRELSSRLPVPTPVAVSAVNPGLCHSRLTRNVNSFRRLGLTTLKALFARTTEVGSRTLVHPLVEPDEMSRHGRFLSSCEPKEESDYAISTEGIEVSRRLWVSSFISQVVDTLILISTRWRRLMF